MATKKPTLLKSATNSTLSDLKSDLDNRMHKLTDQTIKKGYTIISSFLKHADSKNSFEEAALFILGPDAKKYLRPFNAEPGNDAVFFAISNFHAEAYSDGHTGMTKNPKKFVVAARKWFKV